MIWRRIRAVMVTSIVWALSWATIALPISAALLLTEGARLEHAPEIFGSFAFYLAVYGFISGLVFALVFMLGERRRTLEEISLKRAALWGFVGASALWVFLGVIFVPTYGLDPIVSAAAWGSVMGALGAVSSAAMVAIARRSAPQFESAPASSLAD